MPVVMVPRPEATCDVCASKYDVRTCAVCGGVFCLKHCASVRIERQASSRIYGEVFRALCDSCVRKNPSFKEIVTGKDSYNWQCEESLNRDRYINAILEGIDDEAQAPA